MLIVCSIEYMLVVCTVLTIQTLSLLIQALSQLAFMSVLIYVPMKALTHICTCLCIKARHKELWDKFDCVQTDSSKLNMSPEVNVLYSYPHFLHGMLTFVTLKKAAISTKNSNSSVYLGVC